MLDCVISAIVYFVVGGVVVDDEMKLDHKQYNVHHPGYHYDW